MIANRTPIWPDHVQLISLSINIQFRSIVMKTIFYCDKFPKLHLIVTLLCVIDNVPVISNTSILSVVFKYICM